MEDTDGDSLNDNQELLGYYSPSNPGANATGFVHTNPLNPDSDGDSFIDSVEIFSDSDPNDPLSFPVPVTITPPPETITLPPGTITQNNTVTTTVEAGIIMVTSVASIVTVLTIIVIIIRKKRK